MAATCRCHFTPVDRLTCDSILTSISSHTFSPAQCLVKQSNFYSTTTESLPISGPTMSASVATSAVGLLDRSFTPPVDPRDSRASQWHDQMDIDQSGQESQSTRQDEPSNNKLRRSTSGAQSGDERRSVLGGLLAALATNSTHVQTTTSNHKTRDHRSVTPPQDSPISVTSPQSQTGLLATGEPDARAITNIAQSAAVSNLSEAQLTNTQTNNGSLPIENGSNISTYPATPSFPETNIAVPMTPQLDNIPIPSFEMPSGPLNDSPSLISSPVNVKRQYDAFARLEFDDGIFYLNTYQCELGRDQHAYHIALRREREAKEAAELVKDRSESSRGKASQRSNIIKAESQIQGSVVSEAGGFAGVDEQPVEGYGPGGKGQASGSRGSRSSDASIVRPADVLHNPSLHAPFDYNKEASRQFVPPAPPIEKPADEDEQPAPITADHLPDPNSCPLIPIHVTSESETTELDGLKAISRRHMKIFWSWESSAFMLEVLGRNGAFLEGEFVAPSEIVPLYTGANIQISSVNFVFRLPHVEPQSPSVESMSNIGEPLEISLTNRSDLSESAQKAKLKLKLNVDSASAAVPVNGESKRRGPGRPPKDGVMSQRERKEREKADKEAKTRALNGEPSPTLPQRKPSKSQLEQVVDPAKPEKRKYNKRKREDGEEEQVLPSIEAVDETPVVETPQPQPVVKKARTKSYSPPYKPKDECTQADLMRPAHNYAVLLYQVLSQTGEISLRQIYKEMQSRWPFFKYMVESDGWTSSVRHNLNQEVGKLFVKGRKEGKGYTWLAKPNAMEEYQAQKNKRSNAPAAPRPRPAPTRANFAPNQGQQLTWQNSGPAPQPNGAGNPQSGPWTGQPNNPNRPGMQPNGQPQVNSQGPYSQTPPALQDPEGPAPPHMIVTFLGVRIIDRFENTMMGQLKQRYSSDEEKMTRWANVFRSARARCLNGSPASSLPEGETEDERTIMTHINNFVKMYKNPAFKGFYANSPSSEMTTNTQVPPTNGAAGPNSTSSLPDGGSLPREVTNTLPNGSGSAQQSANTASINPTAMDTQNRSQTTTATSAGATTQAVLNPGSLPKTIPHTGSSTSPVATVSNTTPASIVPTGTANLAGTTTVSASTTAVTATNSDSVPSSVGDLPSAYPKVSNSPPNLTNALVGAVKESLGNASSKPDPTPASTNSPGKSGEQAQSTAAALPSESQDQATPEDKATKSPSASAQPKPEAEKLTSSVDEA